MNDELPIYRAAGAEILSDAISQIYADKLAFLNPNGIQSISPALERSDYAGSTASQVFQL
jgi:hypothetical protein